MSSLLLALVDPIGRVVPVPVAAEASVEDVLALAQEEADRVAESLRSAGVLADGPAEFAFQVAVPSGLSSEPVEAGLVTVGEGGSLERRGADFDVWRHLSEAQSRYVRGVGVPEAGVSSPVLDSAEVDEPTEASASVEAVLSTLAGAPPSFAVSGVEAHESGGDAPAREDESGVSPGRVRRAARRDAGGRGQAADRVQSLGMDIAPDLPRS